MTDKILLVTGGSRGIGAAICRLAGRSGYAVAVNYQRDRAAADRDAYKADLAKWVDAVKQRDDALKKEGDEVVKASKDRNDAVEKFNDLANKYNDVVKALNAAQAKLADAFAQPRLDERFLAVVQPDAATVINEVGNEPAGFGFGGRRVHN